MQQKGKYTKMPQLVGTHREVGDDHADDYNAPHEVETLQAMRRATLLRVSMTSTSAPNRLWNGMVS